jgi:hypothetical protein
MYNKDIFFWGDYHDDENIAINMCNHAWVDNISRLYDTCYRFSPQVSTIINPHADFKAFVYRRVKR